jgi:prepilin peptidase CpaA
MIEPVVLILIGAVMIAGAVYDATTLTIPNWVSGLLLGLFPIAALVAGLSWAEAGIHVGVAFAALLAGMGLFAAGTIGGGDAKLFAAIALYVGATAFGFYLFAVALAGGVLAGLFLAMRWVASSSANTRFSRLGTLIKVGPGIPYGVAIAAGGLFVLPATRLFMVATP